MRDIWRQRSQLIPAAEMAAQESGVWLWRKGTDMKRTALGGAVIAALMVVMMLTTTLAAAGGTTNAPAVALMQATAVATSPAAPTAAGAQTGGQTLSGKVTRTGDQITINSNNQDRQFAPAPNLAVVRDGRDVTFRDLREGDQVNVTTDPQGRATRIEATSEAGFPWWVLLLPLLLLIPLLLWLLSRRRKDAFIVERNTGGTTTTARPTETTTTRTTTTSDSTADRNTRTRP